MILTKRQTANTISLGQKNRLVEIIKEELLMVFEKIKAILAEQFDVEEDDLMMSIEDEFEFEVADNELENVRTVDELVKFVEQKI